MTDQLSPTNTHVNNAHLDHVPTARASDQLATWHANRGSKSILRAMIPTWQKPPVGEEKITKNPFKLLGMVSPFAWLMFFSVSPQSRNPMTCKFSQVDTIRACENPADGQGWLAWTMDGYDFFSVSLSAKLLGKQFGVDTKAITTAITLTLLFRSLGALIFGVLADRFGRKWTLVGNLLLIAIFELGSGFCNTYAQFLAVRSLFGIAMGGIWGQAAA